MRSAGDEAQAADARAAIGAATLAFLDAAERAAPGRVAGLASFDLAAANLAPAPSPAAGTGDNVRVTRQTRSLLFLAGEFGPWTARALFRLTPPIDARASDPAGETAR